MTATFKSGRPWCQFSLAALLVVVTFTAVVVREANVVKQRREALALIEKNDGRATMVKDWSPVPNPPGESIIPASPDATIPLWRRWMGDEPVAEICWTLSAKPEDMERASAVFPEAGRYLVYPSPPQSPIDERP